MPVSSSVPKLLLLGAFAVMHGAGCVSSGSLVEKGERIQTGKNRFDGYFGDVIELSEKVKDLDSDLFPLRQPLTEAFAFEPDTPLVKLMAEVRARVEKYKGFGVTVSLRVSPNPTVVLHKGELGQEEADEITVRAIQESAVRALATYREYGELLEFATRLDDQREKLMEQLERLGSAVPERGRIEDEILGAGRVLASVQDKLFKDMRTCALLLVALGEAVETGAAESRDTLCDDALAHYRPRKQPARRGKKWGSGGWGSGPAAPKGRPSGGGASRPAPPPPSPPKKGGGDFDM